MNNIKIYFLCSLFVVLSSCKAQIEHKIDPIEIKPIEINMNIKIDRELETFFEDSVDSVSYNEEQLVIHKLIENGYANVKNGYIVYNGNDNNMKNIVDNENQRLREGYLSISKEKNIPINEIEKNAEERADKIYRSGAIFFNNELKENPDKLEKAGNFYALIIGISEYESFPKLETPINDAIEVEMMLKNSYGFDTCRLLDHNATRRNIIRKLNDYCRNLKYGDSLIIYYAGHGDLIEGDAYWLPVDSEKDDDTNWIIVSKITALRKRIKASHVLIVADSCYSGAFRSGGQNNIKSTSIDDKYIAKLYEMKSRILLASGGKEPVVDSGKNGHSVFANAFLNGLKIINKPAFTVDDLFINYIRETVAGNSKQTPTNTFIENSGHSGGMFIFFKQEIGG
jgi:hypothetical protein